MIACTENCKYQKNGECTFEEINVPKSNANIDAPSKAKSISNCAYFEEN